MTDTHTCPPFGMKSYNCQQKTHIGIEACERHRKARAGTVFRQVAPKNVLSQPPPQKMLLHNLSAPKHAFSQPPSRERPGKTGSILCFSAVIKSGTMYQCAVGDSTPGPPFRVAGPQGERLPVLEPEHLARRRRRVPAPTPGTVSPTALARRSHRSI